MGETSTHIEREVKLGAWAGLALPDLSGVAADIKVVALPTQRLSATYYDTVDLRLARWGVTVRHRSTEASPTPAAPSVAKAAASVAGVAGALAAAVALPDPAVPQSDPAGSRAGVSNGASGPRGAGSAAAEPAELPWTVKVGASGAPEGGLARRELGFSGRETKPPAELLQLVRGLARGAALVPVARLRTDRLRWQLLQGGRRVCEIDDDEVSVLVAGPTGRGRRLAARFRELEVELADGADAAVLDAVVAELRAAGAGAPDPTPKVARALGPRASQPPDVVPGRPGRKASAAEVVRAAIANSVDRLFKHDPGVRLGDDPEDVHQARVATRRLRSDLRTFGSLLDESWNRALRDELGWIAALLGDVRDTDVLLARLEKHAAGLAPEDAKPAAALLARLAAHRSVARTALLLAFDSSRYTDLLDRLVDAAREPVFAAREPTAAGSLMSDPAGAPATAGASSRPPADPTTAGARSQLPGAPPAPAGPPLPTGGAESTAQPAALARLGMVPTEQAISVAPPSEPAATNGAGRKPAPDADRGRDIDRPAIDVLPALVKKPWSHLQRAVAELGDTPADDQLHEVRIRAKRCRYAAEAVAPVVGKPAVALAAAVADLQGLLGDFHDAIVAEEWLRGAAGHGSPTQALVAGQLITVQRLEAQVGRDSWPALWKAASAKKLRAWLAG